MKKESENKEMRWEKDKKGRKKSILLNGLHSASGKIILHVHLARASNAINLDAGKDIEV